MSPVFTIFGLEWRRAWSNRRALVVVACVAALTVTAAIDGARRAVKERQEQIQATAAMRDFWIGQGQANPHSAAHFGVHVFQPTPRLAFFEPGHLSALPSASHLEAHHQNLFRFRPSRDEAPGWLFSLTPAGLLQVLMPLWALFLAFDAVSGERARGTLAQLFLAGASARQLLLGKALGVLSVLGAAMAPAALVSIFVGVVWVGIDRGDVLVLGWKKLTPGDLRSLPAFRFEERASSRGAWFLFAKLALVTCATWAAALLRARKLEKEILL